MVATMRRILLPTALLATALILTGCSAGGGASSSDQSAPEAPVAVDGGTSQEFSSGADTAATDLDRQVITTGWVTVKVDSPLEAAREAVRITEQAGGRVDGRSEYAPQGEQDGGSATLTLRVPADDLTEILDRLKELGEVQEVSLNSSDVTMETQDLDARISALSASIDRLLGLLATATDTDALITLETAISDRQAELESLEAQRRYLADQVAMSTLSLNLVTEKVVPEPEPANFLDGIAAGWNAFVGFFAGLLVVLGVLLPWLVLGAIITVVVVFIVRRTRARKAATSLTPPD
jgi:hypothetical protein